MDQILLIALGIVLVVVGFLIALLVIPLFNAEKKNTKDIEARITEQEIPKPLQPAAAQARGLRVWRDLQKDKLLVELDGQVFDSISQLSQAQRSFLSLTATDLVAWMSKAVVGSSPAPSPEILQPKAYDAPSGIKPAPLDQEAVKPFVKPVLPESPKAHVPAASLAAQIDEILQEKLAVSPLAQHTIHLAELPNYGMSVQVDREQYDSVDSIPDEEVRKLIRSAVEEWQRRSRLRQP
jgi:type II secretory pathway pseudopilin PulG